MDFVLYSTVNLNGPLGTSFGILFQRSMSRVARICKNDVGGDQILRDYWTTFSKATLNCTANGVRYDELTSVYFDDTEETFYGAFTKFKSTGIPSSAICAYSIKSLRDAFGGSFLY